MPITDRPIRWGILSTANIARSSFLPGLTYAGGQAYMVAGRDLERTRRFAESNGVEHAVEGYRTLLDDDSVDAVYNPLPNALHAKWTIAALEAGKAVLCEKPLCISAQETEQVLEVARRSPRPLWEAFVWPFRQQTALIKRVLDSGEIGAVWQVESRFTFALGSRDNIRLDPNLGGGGLYDVGCYPISFGRWVLGADAQAGTALVQWSPEGVDEEAEGVLRVRDGRTLVLTCGMNRPVNTFTRILGTEGEMRLTNPFHPGQDDLVEVRGREGVRVERPNGSEPSFGPAIAHIHAVLQGEEEPRHLAVDEALGNARAIDLLLTSGRSGRVEQV